MKVDTAPILLVRGSTDMFLPFLISLMGLGIQFQNQGTWVLILPEDFLQLLVPRPSTLASFLTKKMN